MLPRVEALRGLAFLRPVAVRSVGDGQAREHVLKRLGEFSPRERLEVEQGAFVLLGLLPPGTDLEREYLEVIEEQAGGFYDPDSGSFFLLDDMPASLAPALAAHELTHALEDQHYDLDARLHAAGRDDDRMFAAAAVHEGSATLVMTMVAAQGLLDGSAPAEDLREFQESDAGRGTRLSVMPDLLRRELLGAYFLGASFLLRGRPVAAVAGGPFPVQDVDAAYRDGPVSSEQILHPEKYWDAERRDPPREVPVPRPAAPETEWQVVADGVLGELALGVITGAPTPDASVGAVVAPSAWTDGAAAGWGGDRWALWRRPDGKQAAVLDTRWDTEVDAAEFEASLGTPAEGRAWRRRGDRVVLAAGDGGVDAAALAAEVLEASAGPG
jgi:hypothetical protein